MGVTYEQLSQFGLARKVSLLGPVGMFTKLLHAWSGTFSPREVYEKVRHFHHYYGINRCVYIFSFFPLGRENGGFWNADRI